MLYWVSMEGRKMIIKNVKVYQEDQTFKEGEICIRDGVFVGNADAQEGEEILDGEGCYAIPGMIDLHFHGCMGYDFCDGTKEAIREIARYEASIGVTAIAPATMTLPVPELEHILSVAAAYRKKTEAEKAAAYDEADLVGVNMEGPFISKAKKGAQDERNIIPMMRKFFGRFHELVHVRTYKKKMAGALRGRAGRNCTGRTRTSGMRRELFHRFQCAADEVNVSHRKPGSDPRLSMRCVR